MLPITMTTDSDSIIGTHGNALAGRKVILAMTGSVAVLKTVELARLLMREGATVIPVMSEGAQRMVGPQLVHWATGVQPITALSGANEHVEYAGNGSDRADLLLVAPATANTIGKIAAAIDDTVVTTFATTAIGQGLPVVVAPAMHEPMHNHPGVRRNLRTLCDMGVCLAGVNLEEGKAKMALPDYLLDICVQAIARAESAPLCGKHVIITAGRTVEYLDPIRVITNNSSGKMGVALARAAFRRGARVTLIYGRGTEPSPDCADLVRVETGQQMYEEVLARAPDADALVAAAAVGDWKAVSESTGKITTHGASTLTIELTPTPKIIDAVRKVAPSIRLVAFRAQANLSRDELLADARSRMQTAAADMIAVNDVSIAGAGFESDSNALTVIHSGGREIGFDLAGKQEIADGVISELARYWM